MALVGGRTGLVFQQCLNHMKNSQPGLMSGIAENVLGLTHRISGHQNSNHDHCIAKFNEILDAKAVTFSVDPTQNGVPMRRPRIYMPFFYRFLQGPQCKSLSWID